MFSFSYFSLSAFIKKSYVFIPFHSNIPTLSHRQTLHRYTFVLWKADLLAWKKRYGCEVGNPWNPWKLRSPWLATVATVATLSYCLVTFLVDVWTISSPVSKRDHVCGKKSVQTVQTMFWESDSGKIDWLLCDVFFVCVCLCLFYSSCLTLTFIVVAFWHPCHVPGCRAVWGIEDGRSKDSRGATATTTHNLHKPTPSSTRINSFNSPPSSPSFITISFCLRSCKCQSRCQEVNQRR